MSTLENNADEILAKCARHCSICRTFKPTHLQIHHIVERSKGGTDDCDNLIAVCISCHSDIHSTTKLTRKYTTNELRKHKSIIEQQVFDGKIPHSSAYNDIDFIINQIKSKLNYDKSTKGSLPYELSLKAIDVLFSAIISKQPVIIIKPQEFKTYSIPYQIAVADKRFLPNTKLPKTALYPDFIIELVNAKLLSGNHEVLYVTEKGYSFIDKIIKSNPNHTAIKAICNKCNLHFILCSWYPEKHSNKTLYCPECGQQDGNFAVYYQKKFANIYEVVPGIGQNISDDTIDLLINKDA